MATKLVNGRKVLTDSQADPGSRKFLRESGGKQVTLADGTQLNALDSKNYGKTPTVLTNAGIIEDKIPSLRNKTAQLPMLGEPQATDGAPQEESDFSIDEVLGISKKDKKKGAWDNLRERQDARANGTDENDDPQFDQMMGLLDEQKKISDRKTKEDIFRIESSMKRLKADQMASNASGIASVRNALGRAGASRYAPGGAAGVMSAASTAGVRALADLNMQEQELISQARSAQESSDYQLLEKKLGLIDSVRKEKAKAAQGLGASLRTQEEQMFRDNALAEVLAQGIDNPVEIFQALQAKGVDMPLTEIASALKDLGSVAGGGTGSFKFEAKQVGPLLASGFTMDLIKQMQDDINNGGSVEAMLAGVAPKMQDAVKAALGVDEAKASTMTPGSGAQTSTDEFLIRTRLFTKVAPLLNKGTLSETDRVVIDNTISTLRDAGKGEQEILDAIAGFPPGLSTPYNSTFRDIAVANTETPEQQTALMSKIASLLNRGSYDAAMNAIENTSMEQARKLDPDNYVGTATAKSQLTNIDEIRTLLAQAGFVGPLEGTFQNVLGSFKGKDAAALKARLTNLVAKMRNDLSGTAVTESERKFLEPLIAEITDSKANFREKLNALQQGILTRYNSSRSSVSLPEATYAQVLRPQERLKLYISGDLTSDSSNTLDI